MANAFISCSYSVDGKYFVGLSDGPTVHIAYWEWEKEVLLHSIVIQNKITKISIHPKFPQIVVASGYETLKIWNVAMGEKMSSFIPGKKEQENFTDHSWTKDGWLVAVTDQVILY